MYISLHFSIVTIFQFGQKVPDLYKITVVMSEEDAIDVLLSGFHDVNNITPLGSVRVQRGDTRIRIRTEFRHFPEKVKSYRMVDACAAAHAEDCYAIWCYLNEDPDKHVPLKEHLFYYNSSMYLNDTELIETLKKITMAEEMENFMKNRYKTKKVLPQKNKKRPIPNDDTDISSGPLKKPSTSTVTSTRVPEDTSSSLDAGESIPLTMENCPLEVVDIVRKATVHQKFLSTAEVHTLLSNVSSCPFSTMPPSDISPWTLFIYDKTSTPKYKQDNIAFRKESRNQLIVNKEPRVRIYYGTFDTLQRRSYHLLETPDIVLVHYTTVVHKTKTNTNISLIPAPTPHSTPVTSMMTMVPPENDARVLVAIGVCLKKISGCSIDIMCDVVNDEFQTTELSEKTVNLSCKMLDRSSREIMGVQFSELNDVMLPRWVEKVESHESFDVIKKLTNTIVMKMKNSMIPEELKITYRSVCVDDKASIALALGKLLNIPCVPQEELMALVGAVMKQPLDQVKIQFELIREALLHDNIQAISGWIKNPIITT